MQKKTENGYVEVNVEAWNDLQGLIHHFSNEQYFIFRGQADSDWQLTTTLDRYLKKFKPEKAEDYKSGKPYKRHLSNFRESLRGRGLKVGEMSENELWALGQHYGLYTPLLDWTYSFYIAVFFAFISDSEPASGYRSVFALVLPDRGIIGKKFSEYNEDKKSFERFELVRSTSEDNPRVINQAGLFTKIPFDFDLQNWVVENFRGMGNPLLLKINISEKERRRVLKELNMMNINPKTIFPDLVGSALDCNFKLFLFADSLRYM